MATGHILPGYGEPVTKVRRALSAGAYPLDTSSLIKFQKTSRLSQDEFDEIKQNAKTMWTSITPKATTYNTYFSGMNVEETTPLRPTSSHRRNNPHPPEIFLTNRLHKIDECQTLKPNTNNKQIMMKYVNYQDSPALKSYKNRFQHNLPPYEAQATEAWLKLADDIDAERVLEHVKDERYLKTWQEKESKIRPRTALPSLYRWMKISGAKEHEATSAVIHKSDSTQRYESCEYVPKFLGQLKKDEIASHGWNSNSFKITRGQYSIHPEWPPTLPHHKVF